MTVVSEDTDNGKKKQACKGGALLESAPPAKYRQSVTKS